jgi:hypothetical protein
MDIDEDEEIKQPRCLSKYHKPDEVGRVGRLYRGEKKYRQTRTHTGKTKTLRDKRKS